MLTAYQHVNKQLRHVETLCLSEITSETVTLDWKVLGCSGWVTVRLGLNGHVRAKTLESTLKQPRDLVYM